MKYLGNMAQDKRRNACKPGRPGRGKAHGTGSIHLWVLWRRIWPTFHSSSCLFSHTYAPFLRSEMDLQILFSFSLWGWNDFKHQQNCPRNSVNKPAAGETWVQGGSAHMCLQNKSHGHSQLFEFSRKSVSPSTQNVLLSPLPWGARALQL